MSETTKMEFIVQMTDKGCENVIRQSLGNIKILDINPVDGHVVVETNKPWTEVKEQMELTGRKAVLTGFGGQSAVAIVDKGPAKGIIRFCSIDNNNGLVVDGVLDGLEPKKAHTINVHEFGDVSAGCQSVGNIYGETDKEGNNSVVTSDENGRTTFRFIEKRLSIPEIIGRSVVVSPITVNDGSVETTNLACGIIARSAGLFQNYKKICACDGVTIWDERDRPVAGAGRREHKI